MIPPAFIEELLGRVDVGEVVGRHVKLRKEGANLSGLCPFHNEKSASFKVSPSKQYYHCYGCGANGDAIRFLMEHLGLSFPDAVADLAQGVGLTVPQEPGTGGRETAQRRDPGLLELMTAAASFYKRRLRDTPRAVDYLKRRGLTGETAARYGIGYAPDAWRGLEAGVPDYEVTELVTAGLVIASDADGGAGGGQSDADAGATPVRRRRYDRFRDRIMFPIRNPRGQVIGFGGRVLDRGEPKYLNSPETPLFSKGHELYGVFEAREALRRLDCALVVEGYMDVVMLAQHGIENAVATLGTATTADHVRKLLRQVDRVVFAFDGDKAGRKAAWRALENCLPHVDDTKRLDFLFFPPDHDPDSYVRAHGADALRGLIDQAESLSAFVLRSLGEQVDLEQAEGRARLLALARPLLQAMPPVALRLQLVHELAGRARISASEVADYLRVDSAPGRGPGGRPVRSDPDPAEDPGPWGAADESGLPPGWGDEHPPWGDAGAVSASAQPGRGQGGSGSWGEGRSGGGRRFGGKGGRGGDGRGWREREREPQIVQGRAQRPASLVRRVLLLTGTFPVLAQDHLESPYLPADLTQWLSSLRTLAADATFTTVCETFRGQLPRVVAQLQADAQAAAGVLEGMGLEDARQEFDSALRQLHERGVKQAMAELVAGGMTSEDDRRRLLDLQAMRDKP